MIDLVFCRTLNSQSAVSITMANYASLLRDRNIAVSMTLINKKCSFAEQLMQMKGGNTLLCKINSDDYDRFFPVLRELQQQKKWKHVILCGPFAALNHETIIPKEPWVDGIILGYGEQAVIDQCSCLEQNEELNPHFDGVWRTANSEIVVNYPKTQFPLSELPVPARDIDADAPCTIANLEFSRGCNNRCCYCHMRAYNDLFGIKRTKKTVSQVMEDIKTLYALGKRYFVFNDSVFWNGFEDTDDVNMLCDLIVQSGMKIYFMVYLSLYRFPDEKLLRKMYDAGLIRVFVGVENPNAKVLHAIKEQEYPVAMFEKIKTQMDAMHISYHIGYMVFYPFSDMNQVCESVEYLHRIKKMHRVGILLERIRLIPGTPICQFMDHEHFDAQAIDKAYQYMIEDPLCEKLQTQLLHAFSTVLQDSYVQIELLCCNLDLLVSIVSHEYGNVDLIKEAMDHHRALIDAYNQLIYGFIRSAINCVKLGNDVGLTENFVKQYTDIGKELTRSWQRLYRCIGILPDSHTKDVFPFWPEWMKNEGEKWNELYQSTCCL